MPPALTQLARAIETYTDMDALLHGDARRAGASINYIAVKDLAGWLAAGSKLADELLAAWHSGPKSATIASGKSKKARGKTAAERRVFQCFGRIDDNDDGKISKAELMAKLQEAAGVTLSELEMEEACTELKLHKQDLEYEEFFAWLMTGSIVSAKVKKSLFVGLGENGAKAAMKKGLKGARRFVPKPKAITSALASGPKVLYPYEAEIELAYAAMDVGEEGVPKGFITREDMDVLADTLGADLSNPEQDEAKDELDPDGEDQVTFETFSLWLKSDESEIVDIINESFVVTMEIMQGDNVKVYGRICDRAGWDTVRASKQVLSGKWYYEVQLGDKASGQIGFARSDFGFVNKADGVGSEGTLGKSWAFDGHKQLKLSGGRSSYPCESWKAGDIVGCLLDLDAGEIGFSLNGQSIGTAFKGLEPGDGENTSLGCQTLCVLVELGLSVRALTSICARRYLSRSHAAKWATHVRVRRIEADIQAL